MSDLISREAAIEAIDDLPNCYNGYSDTYDKAYIIGVLEELPTIDVPERKVGKWIKDGVAYSLYKCSACNDFCTVAGWADCIPKEQMYKGFKFCPNCGAKMRGEEDEIKTL